MPSSCCIALLLMVSCVTASFSAGPSISVLGTAARRRSAAAADLQRLQNWTTSQKLPGTWRSVFGASWQTEEALRRTGSSTGSKRRLHTRLLRKQGNKGMTGTTHPDATDPIQRNTWDAEPGYHSHYSSEAQRPNVCKIAHTIAAPLGRNGPYNFTKGATDYIPFIGTSLVRDSQLMLLRLFYSIDYPVQRFVVVVAESMLSGRTAIAYEVQHLLKYPQDKVGIVIISCQHQPSVAESWNAVFQTFKEEPWGLYMARDTFWERGALEKLAQHGWQAATTGNVDVGYMKWSNMGEREAIHNIFMMTSKSVKRFGLWDENIFPALCEDIDMFHRMRVMIPPMKEQQYLDVLAVHGSRTDEHYWPGAWLPDDPHDAEETKLTHYTVHIRHSANCNYFMRKWGCPSEAGNWMSMTGDCRFKTPFNKSVPHWYWHTSKEQRDGDRWLTIKDKQEKEQQKMKVLVDSRSNEELFKVPEHYGEWGGYFDPQQLCRLSGYLGRMTAPDGRNMCR